MKKIIIKNNEVKNEILFIILILLLNINRFTAILSVLILFEYGRKSTEKSLKAIIYSFLISQLNTSLFDSNIGWMRTLLNLFFIINILFNKQSFKFIIRTRISLIMIIYCMYIIISSIFISWLPLVSIFKAIYFTSGFLAIFTSVMINKKRDLIYWMNIYFKVVSIINLILIVLPEGYSTNKVALNGIFMNPNSLGVVMVLAVSIFLYCDIKKIGKYNISFVVISSVEIFMSNSRTSIITLVLIILYYTLVLKPMTFEFDKRTIFKQLGIVSLVSSIVLTSLLIYKDDLNILISEKLLKGQSADNILYSREGQIDQFRKDFYSNKILGVGFGVDNANGRIQSFQLKLSYPVERGNIFFAILSETGILGFMIFLFLISYLFYYSKKNNNRKEFFYKMLFMISIVLISFGEMTFFSANSLGVIQWLFIALFTINFEKTRTNSENILKY